MLYWFKLVLLSVFLVLTKHNPIQTGFITITSKPLIIQPPKFDRIMYLSYPTSRHKLNVDICRHHDVILLNLLPKS